MRALHEPEPTFTPPALFDGFALEGPLGRGGMGHVYLGRDIDLDRAVALKFVASREGTTTALERFRREARAIARLSHPNVVSIYRIGDVAGTPYIAYELVSGKSLDKTAMPLPWQIVLRIALGMARGLEAVHRASILHRDLKPANVVLSDRGEVKLIDFGLASLVAHGDAESEASTDVPSPTARTLDDLHLTRPGTVLGTPAYIAPELWCGEPASSRSDVFALGMTVYEMLTGVLPHAKLPYDELSRYVLLRELPALRTVRPDLPESFASVVERCLRKDPDERFRSGAEVCDVLETTARIFLPAGASSALTALALDPNHVAVASSFTRVKTKSNGFARTIYDRLFAKAPALRDLFPAEMTAQENKLVHMVEVAIDALSSPESLDGVLADLGRRHVHYGARPEHFTPLWSALVEALEEHEGAEWTPELAAAWRHAFAVLEARMRRGMEGEKPTVVSGEGNILRHEPPMFGARASTDGDFRPPRTEYARTTSGAEIAFQVFGGGGGGEPELVVMLGWLSHLEMNWGHATLQSFLRELGRSARVLVYDPRGSGLSDRGSEGWALDGAVEDLRVVCEAAGLRRPVLFACAESASTALAASALHPELVRGLVLWGATPKRLATSEFPHGLDAGALTGIEQQVRAAWGEPLFVDVDAPSRRDDRAFREWRALYMRMAASPNAACAALRAAAALDLRALLPHVHVPTLVVHRAGDRAVPGAAARHLAEHLPHASLAELPGDDHLPYVGDGSHVVALTLEHAARWGGTARAAVSPPLRFVVVARSASASAPVVAGTADLARTLGGTSLVGRHEELVAHAFTRASHAAIFVQRIAESAKRNGADIEAILDAAPLAEGDETGVVSRALAVLGARREPRAVVTAVAACLLAASNVPLQREAAGAEWRIVVGESASAA